MKLLMLFIVLNIVNVILQTVKAIATVKCGKAVAALVNAVAFGLYTVVIVYTNCELNLWVKVAVVSIANLIGVYVVKYLEEKGRKDKLWLVKVTIPYDNKHDMETALSLNNIPFTCYEVGQYFVFDTFCNTQKETSIVAKYCTNYGGKAFATENKLGL